MDAAPRRLGGLQSRAEAEAFGATPLAARGLPASTYEFLLRGCGRDPARTAITFFLRGDEFAPGRVSLRSRASHLALRLLRGERFARPLVRYSFAEVAAYVTRTANLLHSLGVREGDVVSLLLPNLPETHFALWGAEAAGIVNPINPLLDPDVIVDIMRAAGSTVLVTLGELPGIDLWTKAAAIVGRVSMLRHVVLVHGHGHCAIPVTRYWKVIHSHSADRLVSRRKIAGTDIAALFHTGGTTGVPKLARHTHANEVTMCWLSYATGASTANDTALVGLPLFHANAALGTGLGALAAGVSIVLAGPGGFRTPGVLQNFFAIAAHYQVTWFSAVPTILAALQSVPGPEAGACTIRWAAVGAAPCPVELHEAFQRRTGIRLIAVYGLTEGTLLTARAPADADARVGCAGIPLPYVEVRSFRVDADGVARECAVDEVGIIGQAGPTVFPGYLEPAHNARLWLTDDTGRRWLDTGDLGRIDADGYLWITGRAKELIIRGGHNIDPAVIEGQLCRHPAVLLAAAVGRPDAYAGELPVAYVALKPGAQATADELLQFAVDAIPERAAVPKEIIVLDALPTTAVGKIFKPELVRREIDHCCRAVLATLAGDVDRTAVEVVADRAHGWVARVAVMPRAGVSGEDLERRVRERLGGYTFQWRVEVGHA